MILGYSGGNDCAKPSVLFSVKLQGHYEPNELGVDKIRHLAAFGGVKNCDLTRDYEVVTAIAREP